jgi:hypothetical protein
MSREAVEVYYSNGIYPYIAATQRILFGWVPFSVGDIFYILAGAWLIYNAYKFIRQVIKKRASKPYLKRIGINFLITVLAVYVSFNLLWGLNYNRRGIDYQLKLDSLNYSDKDLKDVAMLISVKMNELQPVSARQRNTFKKKRTLFKTAVNAYDNLNQETPFIEYTYPSVKPSLFSYLGNYLGFTGYYNPFSGEAQVNTTVPLFVRPFTTCHEIGHQLGYAKESEANFSAYLSATASGDTSFMYSVYFEMFAYTSRYLYYSDSVYLKRIMKDGFSQGVKNDFTELRDFYNRYENPFETAIDRLYSQYLKANQQPTGKLSYSEVVAMLIAYYRRTGKV